MMISENSYYETYLKGKSPERIQTCIRRLKREIGHCKKQLEHGLGGSIEPTRDVVLSMNREYLERAKQALVEAGGEYVPTKREIAGQKLKNDFQHISKFEFSIGGYFGGYDCYDVQLEDGDIHIAHHKSSYHKISNCYVSYKIEDFYAMLEEIHLEEWKHNYKDPGVCDGTQWGLTVTFTNGRRKMSWYGSNAYPPEFNKLEKFFDCSVKEEEDGE